MVAAAKQEAAAILAEARATAEKMTVEAQAARDELLPERDSMIEQAALIRSAAEAGRDAAGGTAARARLDREHAQTVRVVLVESALAQLEQPLHGEVGLVDDLTSRLSNATD